jgi:hypothetical protein
MDYEKKYESWKKRRAGPAVPADFTDRVMASVHRARVIKTWIVMQRLKKAFGRSKSLQIAVYSAALAFWFLRMGTILAIFIPRG